MKSIAGHPGFISPCRWTAAFLALSAVWLLLPDLVQAAIPLGEVGRNVAENSKGVAKGIYLAGFATGIGMGVWGCVDMYKATRQQGQSTYTSGIIKLLIAAVILGLGETIGSGSATLFGSDQTSGLGELGL